MAFFISSSCHDDCVILKRRHSKHFQVIGRVIWWIESGHNREFIIRWKGNKFYWSCFENHFLIKQSIKDQTTGIFWKAQIAWIFNIKNNNNMTTKAKLTFSALANLCLSTVKSKNLWQTIATQMYMYIKHVTS